MAEPLRPLSTGELLDRTFSIYRQNFKLFVGVSIVGPIAGLIYNLLFVGGSVAVARINSTSAAVSMVIGIVVGLIVMLAGMAISSAATVKTVAAVYLGRAITVGEAYRSIRGRFWRIIGIFVSVAIRVFLGGGLLVSIGIFAIGVGIGLGSVLGTWASIIGGIIGTVILIASILAAIGLFVRYAVAVQACVVEDVTGKQALKRSVFLTKGDRTRVLTVYGVFMILSWVVAAVLSVFGMLLSLKGNVILAQIVNSFAGLVAGAVTAPLGTIGLSLVYYDERVRKEAFDLQLMMDSLEPAITAEPAGSAQITSEPVIAEPTPVDTLEQG